MKEICPIEKCTGCFSCLAGCKHEAIEIREDACGFRYPVIKQDLCTDCMLCQKSCPVIHLQDLRFPDTCYAVALKDDKESASCASGGAATALSKYVLSNGGVVFGCSGGNARHIEHIRVSRLEELPLLKGSKYVQSDLGMVFRQVKKDLDDGLQTLFIGTPCQVAGLKSFLKRPFENLITADLVCHGVPSQKLLNDNLTRYTSRMKGLDEDSVHFREKKVRKNRNQIQSFKIEFGWYLKKYQPYSAPAVSVKWYKDPYLFGFMQGLFFRECCYKCRYAYAVRVGDITLSDYWGLGGDSSLDVNKGASAVLVNTPKGAELFAGVKGSILYEEREVQEAVMGNGQLQHPSVKHPNHELFRTLYPQLGLEQSVRKCLRKDLVKLHLKNILLTMIRLLKKL